MRRFFFLILLTASLLIVIAAAGGSLPEGNPLRDATGWLREFGRKFADGFGGGYPVSPG